MHGLMRVRGRPDDAHIFCTEDQIASEVANCALVKEIYRDFRDPTTMKVKFSVPAKRADSMKSGTRPPALAEVTKLAGLDYPEPGRRRLYGPEARIHAQIRSAVTGSAEPFRWTSTSPGNALGAEYVGKEQPEAHSGDAPPRGPRLHRTLPRHPDRGIHGRFPLWFAPVQARVLPISEKFVDYAKPGGTQAEDAPASAGTTIQKKSYKIRSGAELQKVPYKLIVARRKPYQKLISVKRKEGGQGSMDHQAFIDMKLLLATKHDTF